MDCFSSKKLVTTEKVVRGQVSRTAFDVEQSSTATRKAKGDNTRDLHIIDSCSQVDSLARLGFMGFRVLVKWAVKVVRD
jgi:hypothetical protein